MIGLAAALKLSEMQLAYVAPSAVPVFATEAIASATAQSRRSLLAAASFAGLAPAWAPAWAEGEKKKERPAENLFLAGRTGSNTQVNGRWSIVFGKKLNDKVVYKKDGETLYLMNNDCGEFQIDRVVKGSCDGLAVKRKGVWVFEGKEDPAVKVGLPGDNTIPQPKKVDIDGIVAEEKAKLVREAEVQTFRGTLQDDEEVAGDRLMNKFGAKIAAGM